MPLLIGRGIVLFGAFDMNEYITYMGYEWILLSDGTLTIGINEEGIEDLTEITQVNLPAEGSQVHPDEVCGDIETDQGPLNLYCPVEGEVLEVNEAILQNHALIQDDCMGDGWLMKIQPEDVEDLDLVDLNIEDD